MFGRIVASTLFSVILMQGAAWAQSHQTCGTEAEQAYPGGAQSDQRTSGSAVGASANSTYANEASANHAAGPTASNQNASNPGYSSKTAANATQTLPQQIRQKLTAQGFTDVEVVPGSFIISARDRDGDPVSMIIGPHSMMVFGVIEPNAQASQNASGNQGNNQAYNDESYSESSQTLDNQ